MNEITRASFLRLSAGLAAGAAAPARQAAAAAARAPRRTLIRGATLLTMDPATAALATGDVLIEGDLIAAVGPRLDVADAQVIDATGMILMPGMVDAHRHLFQDVFKNYPFRNYLVEGQMLAPVIFSPADLEFASYLGGMTALDAGVTTVVDFCHAVNSPEQAEGAVEGLMRSGVAGIFTPGLPTRTTYGPGVTIPIEEAWQQNMGPPDQALTRALKRVRTRYFASDDQLLQFGVALTAGEFARRTPEEAKLDFRYAAELEPVLMVQHVLGVGGDWKMGLAKSYRLIPDYYRAGLLGPKYAAVHGNGLKDDELKMLADSGATLVATTPGETFYANPPVHARARELGCRVAIGIDGAYHRSHDYFDVIRSAQTSLSRDDRDMAISRKMTPLDYLKIATIDGAKAINLDRRIGSITPGKRADLVLLRTDRDFFPAMGDVAEKVFLYASVSDVDSVWVGGTPRKRNRRLVDFNWAKSRDEAGLRSERIMGLARQVNVTGRIASSFPGRDD